MAVVGSSRHRRVAGSLRRQRGAAAVFAAISIIAGLIAAGLAIDLGRLYYAQRDLQRLANMAALDSVRIASGCMGEVDDPGAAAHGEAMDSVQRNGGRREWVTSTAADILGRMNSSGGLRAFQPVPDVTNRAVQVRVSRAVPPRLVPLFSAASEGRLVAVASAYNTPSALVKVGSRPANLSPSDAGMLNNLYRGLLGSGSGLNIDLLSYEALFEAEVPLGAVLGNLGLGDDGADTPTSLSELILAVVDSLGDPVAVAAAQQMYNAADGSRTVVPGLVLGVDDTASGSFSSAGDLLTAAAAASLDGSPVTLPINLPPPLSAGSTTLRLLDPGVLTRLLPGGLLASAENFAHNTSLVLQTDSPVNISGLGGRLSFFVQAGHSTAEVLDISCARRGQPVDSVDVLASASLTRVGIGRFDDINSPNPQPQPVPVLDTNSTLNVLGLQLPIRIRMSAGAFVNVGQEDRATFTGMRSGEMRRLGTPGSAALVNALADIPQQLTLTTDISLLGPVSPLIRGTVNAALATLRTTLEQAVRAAIVGSLLQQIDDRLLPQLQALGVTIGGADVYVEGIEVKEPLLFTH